MWTYKGKTIGDIIPVVKGEMRVNSHKPWIYLFDIHTPAYLKFVGYDEARDGSIENYDPQFTEEWMNDTRERISRESIRMVRGTLDGKSNMLFEEYGQNGYWWTSDDVQTIYVMSQWHDYTSDNSRGQLSFWKSINGGDTFKKSEWFTRGNADGMYFDAEGKNGYIIVGDFSVGSYTVWQTQDEGEIWTQLLLPISKAEPIGFKEFAIDSAFVDSSGNLFVSMFNNNEEHNKPISYLYEIPFDNQITDLSQIEPKIKISDKRILHMERAPQGGFYLMYIACSKDKSCIWPEGEGKQMPIYFAHYINGSLTKEHAFSRFLPVDTFFVGHNGLIYILAKRPDANMRYTFISKDGGNTWEEEDITEMPDVSNYIDYKTNQHWQYRVGGEIYIRKIN